MFLLFLKIREACSELLPTTVLLGHLSALLLSVPVQGLLSMYVVKKKMA